MKYPYIGLYYNECINANWTARRGVMGHGGLMTEPAS